MEGSHPWDGRLWIFPSQGEPPRPLPPNDSQVPFRLSSDPLSNSQAEVRQNLLTHCTDKETEAQGHLATERQRIQT